MLRFYRVDLLDFYRGELTVRRLLTLLRHLPADSACSAALRGDDWTRTDHLLAVLFDATTAGNWQRGNQGRKSPTARPRPLPRPGVTDDRKAHRGEVLPVAEVRRRHAKYKPATT